MLIRSRYFRSLSIAGLGGAVALLLVGADLTQAQNWDCSDSGNLPQQGMNYCAHQDYLAADAELNRVYKQVRAKVADLDYGARRNGKSETEALRDAQRAWIAYRDLACDGAGLVARGGSLEPLLVATCLEDLTIRRSKDLEAMVAVQ